MGRSMHLEQDTGNQVIWILFLNLPQTNYMTADITLNFTMPKLIRVINTVRHSSGKDMLRLMSLGLHSVFVSVFLTQPCAGGKVEVHCPRETAPGGIVLPGAPMYDGACGKLMLSQCSSNQC